MPFTTTVRARAELSGLPQLLHSAVRRESRVGQGGERLGLRVEPVRDDDDVAVRNGHVLGIASRGSEPSHLPVAANLFVAFTTLPTRPVTPVGVDHNEIAFRQPRSAWHVGADGGDPSRDLVPRG